MTYNMITEGETTNPELETSASPHNMRGQIDMQTDVTYSERKSSYHASGSGTQSRDTTKAMEYIRKRAETKVSTLSLNESDGSVEPLSSRDKAGPVNIAIVKSKEVEESRTTILD